MSKTFYFIKIRICLVLEILREKIKEIKYNKEMEEKKTEEGMEKILK